MHGGFAVFCPVFEFNLSSELFVPDTCFNAIQLTDQLKRLGGGFRVCLFGALKVTPRMRPAFRMGHQCVLPGIARIGFITIRDQRTAERLAQHISYMTGGP